MKNKAVDTCKILHGQIEDLVNLVDDLHDINKVNEKSINEYKHIVNRYYYGFIGSVGIHLGIAFMYMI